MSQTDVTNGQPAASGAERSKKGKKGKKGQKSLLLSLLFLLFLLPSLAPLGSKQKPAGDDWPTDARLQAAKPV